MIKKLTILSMSIFVIASCVTEQAPKEQENTLLENINKINECCFEIVIRKPENDSLTYDKPLNWDLLSYVVRNDNYIPLGTGFAISENELITAAHVMHLDDNSIIYPQRFIREKIKDGNDKIENVYEVDKVVAYNNHKDYVIVTLKNKKFSSWLNIENNYQFNTKIFTAGNAYGEGIVIREGILLDVIPENENGEWNYLKSTIASNPGSSGGPLMDENFNVIGIVLSRKDDFCYSLPLHEVAPNEGKIHNRVRFGFSTYAGQIIETLDQEIILPIDYRDFIQKHYEYYFSFYYESMQKLFETYGNSIFPNGDESLIALYNARLSAFPQIFLKNPDNNTWFSTKLETGSTEIDNNGRINWAEIYENSGVWFVRIYKPDDISLEELYKNPKTAMDILLQGINIKRKITDGDPGSRILSYGEPYANSTHTDRYGRKWIINTWIIEYSDQAIITFALPIPKGLALIYRPCSTNNLETWMYDLKKIVDFVNVSYLGKLKEWDEFLKQSEFLFSPISDISLSYLKDKYISINTNRFSMEIEPGIFNINDGNILTLGFDIYPDNKEIVWDIRKIVIDDGIEGENYILSYRWNVPIEDLPEDFHIEWKNYIINREHPYNQVLYSEEGRTNIGSLHPYFIKDGVTEITGSFAYTVYLSKAGSIPDEEMIEYYNTFISKMKILE